MLLLRTIANVPEKTVGMSKTKLKKQPPVSLG